MEFTTAGFHGNIFSMGGVYCENPAGREWVKEMETGLKDWTPVG